MRPVGTNRRLRAAAIAAFVVTITVVGSGTSFAPAGASEVRADVVCDDVQGADAPLDLGAVGVTGEPVEPTEVVPAVPPELLPTGIEQIRAYDIDIDVNPDGSADFTETIEYDFGRTPDRHGIFRDLRLTQPCNSEWERVYPLTDLSVSSPTGAPAGWVVENETGLTRVRIGSADINVKGVHTYVISYRLAGVVNDFPDRVEFYWNVIGDRWPTTLWNIDVAVAGPDAPLASRCFAGRTGSTEGCGEVTPTASGMDVTQAYLSPYEGMTVALAYPPDSFAATPRYYDEVWSIRRAFSLTPLTVGGSSALLAAAIVGVVALGYHVGRDRRAIGAATDIAFAPSGSEGVPVPLFESSDSPVEFAPPDGVRPAQFALLRNEEVRNVDISATIVDLAVRGLLRIEESGGSKRRPDYRLMRLEMKTDGLLEYERTLINRLFAGSTEVQLSALEDTFASSLQRVRDAVYADGVGRGWYAERPDKVKARWRGIGFLLVLIGAGLLGAAIAWTQVALLPIPVIIAGILVFAFAGRFPRRTPAGTGLRRRIGGFEIFMTDSEAPRARWAENRNIFSEYLPFAVVLGITKGWARSFEPLGAEAVAATTTWYVGHDPFSFDRFSSATDRFASSAGSTLASTPQSSSGSSGFSGGGGSSGGGGGGGGGGSW
jgi:uncharacterized protein (TIGR04222 family)